MAASTNPVHLFGVRHHGPGCARSLVKALEALQPDCVLIEGPPEADDLLTLAGAEGMEPPETPPEYQQALASVGGEEEGVI